MWTGLPVRRVFEAALLGSLLFFAAGCQRRISLHNLLAEAVRLQQRGSYEQALAKAREGESRAPSNSSLWWRFRLLQPEIRMSLGQDKEVEKELGTPIPPTAPDFELLEARRQMILGWSYLNQRRLEDCGAALRAAARLAARDRALLAQTQILQGLLEHDQGEASDGETQFRSALALAEAAGDSYLQASALGNLGLNRIRAGRYEESIFWFEQVLARAERLESRSLQAITFDNLGWSWLRLGELDRAASYFDRSWRLFEEMGKRRNLQISLGNVGTAWLVRGDKGRARQFFGRALQIAEGIEEWPAAAEWLVNLAALDMEEGRFDEAAQKLARARRMPLEDGDRRTGAWLQILEGRLAQQRGDFLGAAGAFQAVAAAPSPEPTVVFEARARLAELAVAAGRPEEAERHYRVLLEYLQQKRAQLSNPEARISWLASLMRFYRNYVSFLWDRGRREHALEVAESSRAQVLAERLGNGMGGGMQPAARLRATARQTGCVLASYWLTPTASYLWVVTPQKVEAHPLPPQSELAADVEAVRRQIEGLRDPTLFPSLARLSQQLLDPVRRLHPACVLVSPDQELYGLNFENLLADERYWIEETEVQVAPSLGLHPVSKPVPQGQLLFGDPLTPEQSGLPPLVNAGKELDALSRLLPEARLIVREQATPGAFSANVPGRFGLIHVAAHAVAKRDNPLDSAVILTPDSGRYQLTAREIAGLRIPARLVTLSACHSAGMRNYAGEGTVGLAWSFLHAGAQNVIAGLWAIDDQSSSRLMARMYEALSRGALPGAALREAKLSFLRSGGPLRKPFYWAPFQLYALP